MLKQSFDLVSEAVNVVVDVVLVVLNSDLVGLVGVAFLPLPDSHLPLQEFQLVLVLSFILFVPIVSLDYLSEQFSILFMLSLVVVLDLHQFVEPVVILHVLLLLAIYRCQISSSLLTIHLALILVEGHCRLLQPCLLMLLL